MNDYAVYCSVDLMLVVEARDEQQAREQAAETSFCEWDCSRPKLSIELLGTSDELDDETKEDARRYREKEVVGGSRNYAEESHGE